jgi:thiol-disulfide isomerase/thioredoxin
MRRVGTLLLLIALAAPIPAQDLPEEPSNEKAKKTYQQALEHLQKHEIPQALDGFKKADKQDGGHCFGCQLKMIKYGIEMRDWQSAETGAAEMVALAQGNNKNLAIALYQSGIVWWDEAVARQKDDLFVRAHEDFAKALVAYPAFPDALYFDGMSLAHMKQDEAAKAQFERFTKMHVAENDPNRQRALRYLSHPELVRARLAPPFAVTTTNGQRVSLDDLQGKVVLIDFWATWCVPCREALPHMKDIVKKFQGQPLIVLSISVDTDQEKWKQFIDKNEMTWLQYCDGDFPGDIAKIFNVHAIPHTFTIDADGVLQDEQIGDAAIDGKLKKLVDHARELQTSAAKTGQ